MAPAEFRFLLLQVRNADDPMRRQEIRVFARALECDTRQIAAHDLLSAPPSAEQLDAVDMVLLGGSGDYSVAAGGPWLERALEGMRELYELKKPTFASCWGFQAMARALGGTVVTDLSRAELGTIELELTADGRRDEVFGYLPSIFSGHAGHQDIVDALPPGAIRLARSDRTENQAFTFPDRLIYCTQFHPELTRESFIERLEQYPSYVKKISGTTMEEFAAGVRETPESNRLLREFVAVVAKRR